MPPKVWKGDMNTNAEENDTYYKSVVNAEKIVKDIKNNIKSLKSVRNEYLNKIKEKSDYTQSKSNIEEIENTLEKQINRLKKLIADVYENGIQTQLMVEEESSTLASTDSELEKQVFNIQKKERELLNTQSKENISGLAANSAYFQLYIYTVIAVILLGYLILKK